MRPERRALAEPWLYRLAGRATRDRQPDLLPSPVIIIIKSTLRAVRALVKECFISPARPLCPPLSNAATPNNPSFDYPGATTSPTENHLGRLSALPLFESLPATHLPSPLHGTPFDPGTLKPAESCLLPSVRQSRGCKDREPRVG